MALFREEVLGARAARGGPPSAARPVRWLLVASFLLIVAGAVGLAAVRLQIFAPADRTAAPGP